MASHVVVIASNHYGPAEIIDDGRDGLLFEPDDVEDLAEKILAVHDNPGRREELAKAARSKVVDKYDVRKVKAQVESILLLQVQGG
jgi:glycosyltransferase involved in cell wall biosynthesis